MNQKSVWAAKGANGSNGSRPSLKFVSPQGGANEVRPNKKSTVQNHGANKKWKPVKGVRVDEISFATSFQKIRKGVVQKIGDHCQLLMHLPNTTPGGWKAKLKVLLDTGGEVSIIRRDVIPLSAFYPAKHPLTFTTANGGALQGGKRCVTLKVAFHKRKNGVVLPETIVKEAEFYEGDIKVDAILGYDWLRDNRIGVYPHASRLALESGN